MSFTRAAARLYMTQPAVSHVIRELEEALGCPLFERVGRGIRISQPGKRFLEKVLRLLTQYEDLLRAPEEIDEQAAVRVGSSITIANFRLPEIMTGFYARYPETPVYVDIDSAGNMEQKILCNDVDIAFIEGTIHSEELIKHPFSAYRMAVVCSPHHPFAGRETVSAEELVSARLLLREKGSAARDVLDSALLLQNRYAEPAWTSVNSQALIQAVKANLGISVLPEILVEEELRSGRLVLLKLKGLTLTNLNYAVYRRDKYLTAPIRHLLASADSRS